MKSLLLILSIHFNLTAFAQTSPDSGFTNKAEAKNLMVNGLKEGRWIEFKHWHRFNLDSSKNNGYRLAIYRDGKPIGVQREYLKSGQLLNETIYINGEENRIEKSYYPNGNLRIELPISNGKMNGVQKAYYENGKLRCETIYVNDKEGATKNYDENGNEIK